MWQAFFPLNFKKALFLKESCSEIWLFQQTEHPHDEDKMTEVRDGKDEWTSCNGWNLSDSNSQESSLKEERF